jgi:hypothetical protein
LEDLEKDGKIETQKALMMKSIGSHILNHGSIDGGLVISIISRGEGLSEED